MEEEGTVPFIASCLFPVYVCKTTSETAAGDSENIVEKKRDTAGGLERTRSHMTRTEAHQLPLPTKPQGGFGVDPYRKQLEQLEGQPG